jgi:hypothetical protein
LLAAPSVAGGIFGRSRGNVGGGGTSIDGSGAGAVSTGVVTTGPPPEDSGAFGAGDAGPGVPVRNGDAEQPASAMSAMLRITNRW